MTRRSTTGGIKAAHLQAIAEAVKNASTMYFSAPGHAVIFGRAEYAVFGAGEIA